MFQKWCIVDYLKKINTYIYLKKILYVYFSKKKPTHSFATNNTDVGQNNLIATVCFSKINKFVFYLFEYNIY